MLKRKSTQLTLAVALTAALILIAGGAAIASNAGFKLNKAIAFTGAGAIGDNWTSLPYFNPYATVAGLCAQTGLSSTGGATVPKAVLTTFDPLSGGVISAACGSAGAGTTNLTPAYRGWRIRQPGSVVNPPSSIIIVGSHAPALQVQLEDAGAGSIGDNWISVPYHTTAVTYADFCASSGLSSTGGATVAKAQITSINAVTGAGSTQACGSAGATTATLVLGEAIRVREPNGPKLFIPAHY